MTGSLADYYHWEETDRGIRIYMQAAMADRLQAEVLPSEKEVGGILLGSTEEHGGKVAAFIDDFVPVPCSYGNGLLYDLSGGDTTNLESALLQAALAGCEPGRPAVLGYYRSHVRDGMSLASGDLSVIESYFQAPASVFLLLKAVTGNKACTAGFFFWEDGRIQSEFSSLEVALGRTADGGPAGSAPQAVPDNALNDDLPADLTRLFPNSAPLAPEAPWPAPPAVVADATQEQTATPLPAPVPAPAAPPTEPSRTPRAWPGLLLRGATISIATAALVLSVMTYLGSRPAPQQSAATRPFTSSLGLRVERNPPDLLVAWDPNTREIVTARSATLSIRDGATQQLVNLDKASLARGSRLYTPAGDDIQFRLEVFAPDGGSVAQSIRVSGAGPR